MDDKADKSGKSPLGVTSLAAFLFLATLGVIVYHQEEYHSPRPPISPIHEPPIKIRARLWQDPFRAILRQAQADPKEKKCPSDGVCKPDTPQYGRLNEEVLTRLQSHRQVSVLAVMVFGGPYVDMVEWRLRQRDAVLSGLNLLGFTPTDPEHIRYLQTDCEPISLENIIPFEWLEKDSPDKRESVLVLWLNDDNFNENPLAKLASYFNYFQNGTLDIRDKLTLRVIGPAGSTTLKGMLDELQKSVGNDPTKPAFPGLEGCKIYSATATVATSMLPGMASQGASAAAIDANLREKFSRHDIHFERTICTDDQLAAAMLEELARRGVGPHDPIVLLAEWDTFYGQNLPRTVMNLLLEKYNSGLKHGEKPLSSLKGVRGYSYLRGIDGKIPGEKNGDDQESKKNDAGSKENQSPKKLEPAMGDSQYDYLRRLADRIYLEEYEPIKAFGILGSDFFDKFLVLQALKQRFPDRIFFTTDLDARLLQPENLPWTRNLLVASTFGLQLHEKLQGEIPPFRDCYQTSVFLATLRAFGDARLQTQDSPIPVIFEIGQSHMVALTPTPGENALYPASASAGLPIKKLFWTMTFCFLALSLLWFASSTVKGIFSHIWQAISQRPLLLAAPILILALSYYVFDQGILLNPQEEPFSWNEGISIWPTEILRLLAQALAWSFFGLAVYSLKTNCNKLTIEYELKNSLEESSQESAAAPSPENPATEMWKNIYDEINYDWERDETDPKVKVSRAWKEYRRRGSWNHRLTRIFFIMSIYLVVCFCIIASFGLPTVPARGSISRIIDRFILILSIVSFLFLTFFVFDATRLCRGLVKQFLGKIPQWDQGSLEKFVPRDNQYNGLLRIGSGAREELGFLMLLRFIADHTDTVGKFIFYPFIVWLILFVLSRLRYFDNWPTPIGLAIVILLGAFIPWISALMLRRSAETLRSDIKNHISRKLIPGNLAEPRPKEYLDRLQYVFDRVEAEHQGAFASYMQHPVVQSLLVPFGGLGGWKLLEYLGM